MITILNQTTNEFKITTDNIRTNFNNNDYLNNNSLHCVKSELLSLLKKNPLTYSEIQKLINWLSYVRDNSILVVPSDISEDITYISNTVVKDKVWN